LLLRHPGSSVQGIYRSALRGGAAQFGESKEYKVGFCSLLMADKFSTLRPLAICALAHGYARRLSGKNPVF
jgi:hypothetical protein